jgi:hypothetical protein
MGFPCGPRRRTIFVQVDSLDSFTSNYRALCIGRCRGVQRVDIHSERLNEFAVQLVIERFEVLASGHIHLATITRTLAAEVCSLSLLSLNDSR